jgi:hypothetical protein
MVSMAALFSWFVYMVLLELTLWLVWTMSVTKWWRFWTL